MTEKKTDIEIGGGVIDLLTEINGTLCVLTKEVRQNNSKKNITQQRIIALRKISKAIEYIDKYTQDDFLLLTSIFRDIYRMTVESKYNEDQIVFSVCQPFATMLKQIKVFLTENPD